MGYGKEDIRSDLPVGITAVAIFPYCDHCDLLFYRGEGIRLSLIHILGKIIFLENYDMQLARRLVSGVDIWLNTPTRPLEASGTSGEKALMLSLIHI